MFEKNDDYNENFRLATYDEKYLYINNIRKIIQSINELLETEIVKDNVLLENILSGLLKQTEKIDELYLYPFLEVEDFEDERVIKYIKSFDETNEKYGIKNLSENFLLIFDNYKKEKISRNDVEYKMLKTLLNEWERNEILEKVERVKAKRLEIETFYFKNNNDNI